MQPMTSVSGRLNSSTPSKINRKFTDIVPSIPGSCTFNPDAKQGHGQIAGEPDEVLRLPMQQGVPQHHHPRIEAVMPTKTFVWIDNLSVSGFIY